MDTNSFNITRFKMQINKFSGNISSGLKKNTQRLFKEMLYGIQASKDVKLSNISRSLQEDIALIKTEERISRNLAATDYSEHINTQILRYGKSKITDEMVIAIDPGDITKPYAEKMEKLCNVYDGSKGDTSAHGYHLCQVTAANLDHDKLVPLYLEAYSSEDENYKGATSKIKEIITKVVETIGTKGTWAIDRQGDNIEIMQCFSQLSLTFVTRLKSNRILHFNRNTVAVTSAANMHTFIKYWTGITVLTLEDDKVTKKQVEVGAIKVALPDDKNQWYTLIAIKGFGEVPILLITNKDIPLDQGKFLHHFAQIYFTRWKCEECYRYIKQSYNLEDLRVLTYNGVRNIVAFVHAIAYFTSIYMGENLKLKVMVKKIFINAKRFFGIPVFYQYAMADGIFELLKTARNGIINFLGKIGKPTDDFQMSLFPD